ncbi:hypothetical protein GCM10027451_18540 [Geodermatophilus aquaeductus]|uniref:Uncharacterized protein n=1 Tax=Geodermatophilus aquaeductus TaxID=1564161 RepID=A0A521E7X9_9ACTN|nr:hypothetical protein [Geodermatophilus aquaeductus]SMO79270.1 hypothetical protein SAMN06273567_104270 [Geodermatophilus aquaeductus]
MASEDVAAARIRYELRVGTHVGAAALSTFRVPVRPTVVPRRAVYRLRVPADRDLAEVLVRLTERDVQVLEIRRCPDGRHRDGGSPPAGPDASPGTSGDPPPGGDGVVVPFRAAPRGPRAARPWTR